MVPISLFLILVKIESDSKKYNLINLINQYTQITVSTIPANLRSFY